MQRCIDELKREKTEFLYPLSLMELQEKEEYEKLSTDGITIYYSPSYVTQVSLAQLKYEVMHIVLHGMMGHFERDREFRQKKSAWTIMDLQVGWLLDKMEMTDRTNMHGWKVRVGIRRADVFLHGNYDFGNCYRAEREEKYAGQLERLESQIQVDDHQRWEKTDENIRERLAKLWGVARELLLSENSTDINELYRKLTYGTGTGNTEASFRVAKGGGRSYEDVLRELVSLEENAREEPDSIDQMWYQYGLEMYGDVPLIEPLEETEQPAIHTLVVAIDVSGSCMSEEIMGRFWGETFQFLQELKNKEIKGEVILIQCDAEITKEEHFSIDQVPAAKPESVKVCGAGGTSFVPVFTRISKLRGTGSIIDGLLYLTDGVGIYPEKKADYPVYFVMPGKKYGEDDTPDWVQSVYLDE
jgi:hypothetical protein